MQDCYGTIYNLTGNETPGKCFWCGCDVSKRRRYCCEEHRGFYYDHFRWPQASAWCLQRYEGVCADCSRRARVAHHIEPLGYGYRIWNILNRPENLVALCFKCHGKRHAYAEEKVKAQIDSFELARERGQFIFEGLECLSVINQLRS